MKFTELPIKHIKAWLECINYLPNEDEIARLQEDERAGVKSLIVKIQRKQAEMAKSLEKWQMMNHYEEKLRHQGYKYIVGIDEVGRGPLAGPVVSTAVILPESFYLPQLNDSKQLSKQLREECYDVIMKEAVQVGIGIVSNDVIDRINILNATKQSMIEAIKQLNHPIDYLLIDAVELELHIPQESLIGGDAKSVSIAAASVVAKVTRDRWMEEKAKEYPQYGFDRHAGYGTQEHREAIANYGITPIHRKSFGGVKEWINKTL